MFYETERIVHKQMKYLEIQALSIINSFLNKKLSIDEIVACLDVMLKEDISEIKVDILNMARTILISKKEFYAKKIACN